MQRDVFDGDDMQRDVFNIDRTVDVDSLFYASTAYLVDFFRADSTSTST